MQLDIWQWSSRLRCKISFHPIGLQDHVDREPEERGRECKLLQNVGVLHSVLFLLFSQQQFWWEGGTWGWLNFLQETPILFWRTVTPMSWNYTKGTSSVLGAPLYHCTNIFITSICLFKELTGFLIMLIKILFMKSESQCRFSQG